MREWLDQERRSPEREPKGSALAEKFRIVVVPNRKVFSQKFDQNGNDVMPAQVVIVLQDPAALNVLTNAIRANGHTVQPFTDPMDALTALERAKTVELLITNVGFPPGKPNGQAIGRMARMRRSKISLVFICEPEEEQHVAELGRWLSPPIDVAKVVALAERLLTVDQIIANDC